LWECTSWQRAGRQEKDRRGDRRVKGGENDEGEMRGRNGVAGGRWKVRQQEEITTRGREVTGRTGTMGERTGN
jgi:hypothetical protein